MRNATWHNFNVILLNCGMNIQVRKIQDKSSYWHKNNNTLSILTKQSCLLKTTWPKKVIPTKSYSLAMLHLHHTKYSNHAQPRWQAERFFHTFDVLKPFQLSRLVDVRLSSPFLPSLQPPFYSTYSALSMTHAHVLRESWKSLRTPKVWNNCLACYGVVHDLNILCDEDGA